MQVEVESDEPLFNFGGKTCGGTCGGAGGGTCGGTGGRTGGLFWVLSVFVLPALPTFFFFPVDSSSDETSQGSLSVPPVCLVLVLWLLVVLLFLPWVAISCN